MDIVKEADSSNDTVAKYAIYTLNELSFALKSNIDPIVFAIFKSLFPRTLDVNEVLAAESEKTIVNVSRFSSGEKVADSLLIIARSKYSQFKYSLAKCLGALYETHFYSVYRDY